MDRQFQGQTAYTCVLGGQFGCLGRALASPSLPGAVTGVTQWHIHEAELDLIGSDTTYKQPSQDALWETNASRSSDHELVIVEPDHSEELPPALQVKSCAAPFHPHSFIVVRPRLVMVAADARRRGGADIIYHQTKNRESESRTMDGHHAGMPASLSRVRVEIGR